MLPHRVKYSHHVKGGLQSWFTIKINPKYKGVNFLYVHEYEHVKQWYAVTFLVLIVITFISYFVNFSLLWLAVLAPFVHKGLYQTKSYRQWSEVQAFKSELSYHNNNKINHLAKMLSEDYSLNITQEQALELLK